MVVMFCSGCGGDDIQPLPPPLDPSGGAPGRAVPNEGWLHVAEGSPIAYRSNPPASGSHYPVWARYEEYPTALPRGYWVHNLEHGAVVFLYHPNGPQGTILVFRDVFRRLHNDPACGAPRALLTPDPDMQRIVAVVAADWILEDTIDENAIRAFVTAHRGRGPENTCAGGTRP